MTDKTMQESGQRFLAATEKLLNWMNGCDLSADHEDCHPDDFREICDAMTAFRSALQSEQGVADDIEPTGSGWMEATADELEDLFLDRPSDEYPTWESIYRIVCKFAPPAPAAVPEATGWATYHAIMEGDYIQRDTRNDQLEIYDTVEAAHKACPAICEVVPIQVRRGKLLADTASPAPDHAADVRKMVAPDVSELEKAAQKLWRESYNCESDFIQAVVDVLSEQEEAER